MSLDSLQPQASDADKQKAFEALQARKALEDVHGEFVDVPKELQKGTEVKKNKEPNVEAVEAEKTIDHLRREGL